MIRHFAFAALLALGSVAGAETAAAQSWPTHPIKLIVPFAAGGPPDVIARVIADQIGPRLGQTIVVENRPSAGAAVGSRAVADAEPDGYTFLYASTTSLSIAPFVFNNIGYDPVTSFAPVAGVSNGPLVVVVNPNVPAKTVQELVAYAKANPGKLNFGSGVGSPPHVAWALFTRDTGANIAYIPYRAMAGAVNDLVAGQIQMMIDGVGPLLPHIQAGKARALAVTGKTRSPEFPELPTMIECGYPDYSLTFWTGIVAPAKTPPEIVAKVNAAINDTLRTQAMKDSLARFNVDPVFSSPQEFATFVADETGKWGGIIKATGIKVE